MAAGTGDSRSAAAAPRARRGRRRRETRHERDGRGRRRRRHRDRPARRRGTRSGQSRGGTPTHGRTHRRPRVRRPPHARRDHGGPDARRRGRRHGTGRGPARPRARRERPARTPRPPEGTAPAAGIRARPAAPRRGHPRRGGHRRAQRRRRHPDARPAPRREPPPRHPAPHGHRPRHGRLGPHGRGAPPGLPAVRRLPRRPGAPPVRHGRGPPLVTTTSGADGRPRLRPVDQLHDPTGRRLTLVVSDCVGPLWQRGSAQRFLRQWPRHSPLALVQPLPPRLWPRTALPAEPGTFQRSSSPGSPASFRSDDEPWADPDPARRAVPVLTPTPEAFASWARLHTGHGGNTVRGWAAWLHPHPAAPRPAGTPRVPRGDDELLRAFRAGASPGALRLAVHLAAAPLTLPVMQLVQRAMLPDTGPMELAEVLLSGLLRRLPGPTPYPCFSYPPGIQNLLLGSLDPGAAALVLKHCSAYVERNFGQGTRNFPALAAARLAGHGPGADGEDGPGLPHVTDCPDGPTGPEDAEAELFARIPARVLRFYHPDLVTPDPLTEARRLLDQGRVQSDPSLLSSARERAEEALPTAPVEARVLLGRILHAEAGTGAVRRAGRRPELLARAADTLVRAGEQARPGDEHWAEARLERAVVHHALWQETEDPRQLDAALAALAEDTDRWPPASRPTLHLRRGRLLLARGEGAAAAEELTAALALGESADALLDLADALHLAAAGPDRIAPVLDRAEPLLGDGPALRLRHTAARARLYETTGDGAAADEAYERATLLAPAESGQRGLLLLTWGESLLRRAAAVTGTRPVDRAESVLREALTCLPGGAAARDRARILIGSVLALRFDRAGFLPDLYESRHLLDEAVRTTRTTRDAATRAEVWLQLGWVQLQLSEAARDGQLVDALTAFRRAADDSRSARGDTPGTVTLARALHAQGTVLYLMDRLGHAATVLREAAEQWRRLDGMLVPLDWADVERTRTLLAEVTADPRPRPDGLSREERRRILPPWWAWREQDAERLDNGGAHGRS
ncbi:SAV_2336 N-terminal domain-related protein [Streptomyces venezuelae ATCC 10712]